MRAYTAWARKEAAGRIKVNQTFVTHQKYTEAKETGDGAVCSLDGT